MCWWLIERLFNPFCLFFFLLHFFFDRMTVNHEANHLQLLTARLLISTIYLQWAAMRCNELQFSISSIFGIESIIIHCVFMRSILYVCFLSPWFIQSLVVTHYKKWLLKLIAWNNEFIKMATTPSPSEDGTYL